MSQLIRRVAKKGFTLIELMIVVAIIGILAAIAIPKFADLITKSRESATKGSLGSVRGAVTIYYSDSEGLWPTTLATLSLGTKYMEAIPSIIIPKHDAFAGHGALALEAATITDAGGWTYVVASGATNVNCSHTDTRQSTWSNW